MQFPKGRGNNSLARNAGLMGGMPMQLHQAMAVMMLVSTMAAVMCFGLWYFLDADDMLAILAGVFTAIPGVLARIMFAFRS